MKKIRLISFVLVFAMMLSLCSCAKEAEHTSSEGSRVVSDDYAKSEYGAAKNIGDVHELMCELIGMNLEEAENRIEEYFCCTLEFESYSNNYGYDDYYFNTEIEIEGIVYNCVEFFSNGDRVCYHVSFIDNHEGEDEIADHFIYVNGRLEDMLGEADVFSPRKGDEIVEFSEYEDKDGNTIATGCYYGDGYFSHWYSCHNSSLEW